MDMPLLPELPPVRDANPAPPDAAPSSNLWSPGDLTRLREAQTRPTAAAGESRLEFTVQGMTCAGCAARVETCLQQQPGVADASVNFATRTATVVPASPAAAASADVALLVAAVAAQGYELKPLKVDDHADPLAEALTNHAEAVAGWNSRLAFAMWLTIPLAIVAMSHGQIAWLNPWWMPWAQAVVSGAVLFGSGWPILKSGVQRLQHGSSDMNTLVALGAIAAWASSTANLATEGLHSHSLYFETAAVIVCFVLLGRWLEERARYRAGSALRGLLSLRPATALRRFDNDWIEVPAAALDVGDRVLVRPGERLPADGTLQTVSAVIDQAVLTGESLPVTRASGDELFAGTLNLEQPLELVVQRNGRGSVLGQIVEQVRQTQGSKAPVARLADRVAAVFCPLVLIVALATAVAWLLLDAADTRWSRAIAAAVAVLVVACPCALGLATPAAIVVGVGRAAELGVLFRSATALEQLASVRQFVFDKTGTLTTGDFVIEGIEPCGERTTSEILALAAALEQRSEHPLARAIVQAALRQQPERVGLVTVDEFKNHPGLGVSGEVAGQTVLLGQRRWLEAAGVLVSPAPVAVMAGSSDSAATTLWLAAGGALWGSLRLVSQLRDDAVQSLGTLQRAGLRLAMLTGDQHEAAAAMARVLPLVEYAAELMPLQKRDIVAEWTQQYGPLAFVGDGVNDASALAEAAVGIAMAGGTDIAGAAAGVVLTRPQLATVVDAYGLARRTVQIIWQNLGWAFGYNLLALPIAAGALYPWTGWLLSPMLASLMMALSSVSVVANSLRLNWYRPE